MNITDVLEPFEDGYLVPRPFEFKHVGPGMFRIDHGRCSLDLSLSDAQTLEALLHNGIHYALNPEGGESA